MTSSPTARRRIGRNFFWKSAAEGSRALQALYFVLLARHLGTAELGRFSVGFSAAMILASAGDLGLNTLLTRRVAAERSQGAAVFLQTAYFKAIFFALLFATAVLWPGLGERRAFVLVFLGIAASRNLIDQISYLCLAHEKLALEAVMKFTLGLLSLGLAHLTLSLEPSVNAAAGALLGAQLFAAAVGLILAARRVSPPLASRWPALAWPVTDARELVAMALISLALAGFSRIDISLLKWLGVPAADIGGYFAAERAIAVACLLPGFLAVSALPIFSQPEALGHAGTIHRLRRELFATGVLAGLLLNVFGERLVALIYGPGFVGAARPLAWLGLALPFMFINHFSLIALIADKRSWQAAFAAFTAFCLNVAIDWAMIPRMGIFGAALGAVCGQAAVSLLTWPFLQEKAPHPSPAAAVLER